VVILFIIPKMTGSESLNTKNLLKFIVFFQYVPRFIRIAPLYKEVTRSSGILTETAWAGAAFNLFLYMLASHVCLCCIYLFLFFHLHIYYKVFLAILSYLHGFFISEFIGIFPYFFFFFNFFF